MEVLELLNYDNKNYSDLFESIFSNSNFFNADAEKDFAEKSIITAINTRLESIATHSQGLHLLSKFLSKISKENLTKYFPHWINKITQILSNAHNNQELTVICEAIGTLIINSKTVPELDKRVSLYHVKQLIGIIVERYYKEKQEALLNLITLLLYHYPESCARLQASYSEIISSCVDDENMNLVNSGAKCYSLLVRALERTFIQSSKNNSSILLNNNSAICHIYHQVNLCNNLTALMDEIFKDLITSRLPYDFQCSTNINILKLSEISCHNIYDYYNDIQIRFTNICTYLSTLLKVGGSGGKKFVLPKVILQVICTGLAITPENLQKKDNENTNNLLLSILPKLHMGLFQILETLITSFQQELVPFSLTIQQLILQTLEWTSKFVCTASRNVRILAYKILSTWLNQTGNSSGFQLTSDAFLLHILKDLSPPNKNVLVLTVKPNGNSRKNNKKTEKAKESQMTKDYSHDNVYNFSDTDFILCIQVLSTVQAIVSNINCHLKQPFCEKIRNTVILYLYEHYVKKNFVSASETNTEYRLQLLKTLRVLQTYSHIYMLSPTPYAIQIFGIAVSQDKNSEIIEEAKLGLAELRNLIYPTAPTLTLPLSSSDSTFSSSQPSVNKIIQSPLSEVNRQIFENENNISAELSKRPRLEDKNLLENSSSNTNTVKSKNVENNVEKNEDCEMITTFCDLPSSNELSK